MNPANLFQLALGLGEPWFVERVAFDRARGVLDLYLDFRRGAKFACPECGAPGCATYDTQDKAWRHLNFFQHETYLHARAPRTRCAKCGVRQVAVAWAREGSGFTLLFEAYVMALAPEMPVMAIAALVGEWDTRLWRVVHHWVEEARGRQDFSGVTKVGIDETSARRGHNYITVVADLDESAAIYVTPGREGAVLEGFVKDFREHGGQTDKVKEVCCDLSPAYIAGVERWLPAASLTFDKFHVTGLVTKAVDEVRRAEQKERPELKGSRYAWLKNEEHLSEAPAAALAELKVSRRNLKTARAWRLRLGFQDLYRQPASRAKGYLVGWLSWAARSRLKPMVKAARTIRKHFDGVLRWFQSHVSNGLLEGLNSLIQAAKARARGHRTMRNLIAAVYLVAGKLDFNTLYPQ